MKNPIKTSMTCFLFALAMSLISCKDEKKTTDIAGIEISEDTKTGSFTVNGETYKGNVSTQFFGSNKETDNFSVLCQQDEPFALLQMTFANRKDATSANLKSKGGSYKVNPGEYGLSLSLSESDKEFVSNDKSGGSVKVDRNTLTISNVKLYDRDGMVKTVSETVEF